MAEDGSYVLRLAVTCHNTNIVPGKSDLTAPTFFKAMLGRKERTAKNEKRVIRLFQSEPYLTSGRPNSTDFKLVYQSEVIENTSDVNATLVGEVSCPEDSNLDRKIRLYVYYSSNLTNGKEFGNSCRGEAYTSAEIFAAQTKEHIGADEIDDVRRAFDGRLT